MSTFRQLALRVIAESGLESEPADNILSPEYVFNWLKARYQKAIDAMPYGNVATVLPQRIVTNAPYNTGVVNVTYGSNRVIGDFSIFPLLPAILGGLFFRADGDSAWYNVIGVNATQVILDSVYVGETRSGINFNVVLPFHEVDVTRWITSLVLPGYGELEELHFSKMLDLDPYRSLAPSQPRMWMKRLLNDDTGKRVVELYPYPDKAYRIDVYGYGSVAEPTLDQPPKKEIDEEMLVCGGMADAFGYRSQLAAGRNENEKAMTFMRLAGAKRTDFDAWVKEVSNRDAHDQEPPRIRVRMTHSQYLFHSPNDSIIDAYDHVWRGNN